MSSVAVVARWSGYCQPCDTERPLVLTSHGRHGLRAWLAGYSAEDSELAYSCEVCGRSEHVPATLAMDEAYDATLLRWPDLELPAAPAEPVTTTQPVVAAELVVTVQAAVAQAEPVRLDEPVLEVPEGEPVRPVAVRTHAVPLQRVDVTDLLDLLALSA